MIPDQVVFMSTMLAAVCRYSMSHTWNFILFGGEIILNSTMLSCASHIIHLATKKCINTINLVCNNTAMSRGDDENVEESWEVGELLGKVLALVKQVGFS